MELFYREVGDGSPLIILHGLYGSSDNWVSIAKQLGSKYRVILIDQRNHGNSPHSQSHTYSDLANDLYDLVRRLNLKEFHLMGIPWAVGLPCCFKHFIPILLNR
jgi:pimeloyl-ACP methyl ester carboxylesterase